MDNEQSSSANKDQEENKMDHEREQSKPKGLTRRAFLKAGGAAIVGAAAGLWLPDSFKTASADAPATQTNVILVPRAPKESGDPETPLYLREFGAPERGVIMRNRVEQGGGNLAYVEMGDQELWNNLLYLRETYGRPDLKLEITYYSSLELYSRDPNRPNYNPENNFVLYWDAWAGNPGIYQNGVRIFSYREADKTLEFRIILPETLPGKVPTEDSVNKMHHAFMNDMLGVFLSKEDGKPVEAYRNWGAGREPEKSDFRAYPVKIGAESPNIFNVSRSALWVKLD